MTATANEIITDLLSSETYEVMSERVDGIAVMLLIVLLVEQQLLRVYASAALTPRYRSLDVAVIPLLAAFVLVVIVRSFDLR
jgi:hypothetical protein